jgi:hypothetical protein
MERHSTAGVLSSIGNLGKVAALFVILVAACTVKTLEPGGTGAGCSVNSDCASGTCSGAGGSSSSSSSGKSGAAPDGLEPLGTCTAPAGTSEADAGAGAGASCMSNPCVEGYCADLRDYCTWAVATHFFMSSNRCDDCVTFWRQKSIETPTTYCDGVFRCWDGCVQAFQADGVDAVHTCLRNCVGHCP